MSERKILWTESACEALTKQLIFSAKILNLSVTLEDEKILLRVLFPEQISVRETSRTRKKEAVALQIVKR